ncbi:MAG TPA: carotenoid 1,2-hydratase, partial [Ramlibacter sp.]|nr:carotenoid 1,2-hydratase [Ramlibacter sp.]
TFFRSRVDATQSMQSRFAAKQLVFAHAALTDVEGKRLWHDQRIAREGFDVATAASGDMRLKLRDWSLARDSSGAMTARVAASTFSFDLGFRTTQPDLLQGDQGLSRKGPLPEQASYYYSEPQLQVAGALVFQGKRVDVTGRAWLDHEWSEALLHPEAMGWDWIGMNLDDGSALMAFRLRKPDGTALWDGGAFRARGHDVYIFSPGEVQFGAQRRWTSPLTRANYPVEWIVRTPADFYRVSAVLDNQELDSRTSTGAIYWEGLSRLFDSNGRKVGSGYLEMTGYAQRLRL